ncbi:ABC transporter ATP-binding protein [Paenibacillus sacheonensis]|uniref:ATP-binding cassette domain-containing protein n=1 Tax=Paenibacillus sacheonensis TaxID=742054 RepID=A0A7X4YVJ1_9BACL|nr:ABC transporter ATP-binding protein [Paenibacillus sacheonensis]MBM7569323.1 NitT/TauT family transport system ATP-binding protein [Paenibacillus sacheonensis]NBC73315.1 ATP-binding cassette domain-containing protein [Paenibacillus sacheonensis]
MEAVKQQIQAREEPVVPTSGSTRAAGQRGEIVIAGLGKVYESKKSRFAALSDIDLSIGSNEFVTVVGPSGCGKSTLLRIVAGLDEQTDGSVTLDGNEVIGPGAERGMVFQGYTLFPWLTVRENIEYGPKLQGISTLERRAISNYFLKVIKLESFAAAYPKQLSGGMKQRVAIARALANRPKVLLMDEPFGALDAQTKLDMQEMLLEVWEKEKTTVLFITHDIEEAIFLSQRIVVMGANPGRILKTFDVKLPAQRTPEVREMPAFLALRRELGQLLKH